MPDCSALIVDDNDDMAFLTRATIEVANHGLFVTGVAASGAEALTKLRETRPNVVVLDYRMRGRNGLEVAADILGEIPDQDIILFSAYLDPATVAEADRLGVRECVSKDQIRDLPDSVRRYGPTT